MNSPPTPLSCPWRVRATAALIGGPDPRASRSPIPALALEDISLSDSTNKKELPQRVFNEILNEGRLEVADEIVAPGFRLHSPTRPEPFEGPDEFKQFVTDLRRGFPDLNVMIEQVIAEGDIVSIRSRVTGTHLGTYRGIPPTGRKIAQSQLHMFQVTDGQIDETWQEIDGLGIMQQLGIFPRGEPPKLLMRLVVGVGKLGRRS